MRGRRKAVVCFSEGIDYDISNPFKNRYAADVRDADAGRDCRGDARQRQLLRRRPARPGAGMDDSDRHRSRCRRPTLDLGMTPLHDELRRAQDSLRMLSDETGGFAAVNQNDFSDAFARIIQDNSSYYVLGYYPTNDKRDGRFRNVQVRVTTPGLTVRARKGYVAPRGKTGRATKAAPDARHLAELREALDSPIPISGLALSAVRGAVQRAGAERRDRAGHRDRRHQAASSPKKDGLFANDLEMSLFALENGTGKIKDGGRDVVDLKLRPQTHEVVSQAAFRDRPPARVPPGRYQLRVGVREERRQRRHGPLRPRRAGLLEGAAVDERHRCSRPRRRAASRPRTPTDGKFKDVLPAPPTRRRASSRGTTLALFTEIYDNHRHARRTASRSRRRSWPTTARRCSRRRTSGAATSCRGHGRLRLHDEDSAVRVRRRPLRPARRGQRCSATPSRQARGGVPGAMIELSTIAQGDASRIVDPRRIVVRTPEEWSKLWELHAGSTAALPSISFAERIVAAAFAGERPTAGHRIDIQADGDGGTVRLRVHERTPPGDALVAQVLTFPFHIVSLPRAAGNVSWAARSSGDEPTAMLASDSVASGLNPQSSTGLEPAPPPRWPISQVLSPAPSCSWPNAQHGCPLPRLAVDSRDRRALAVVAIGYVLAILSLFSFVGAVAFFVRLSSVIWIATLALCVVCVWKASLGGRWKLPLVGGWAEQMVTRGARP